ncbi:MAG: DNA primase [Microbacteriaceae bacterium]|nr:DNA primase [Microbacteriaceae bacterium]
MSGLIRRTDIDEVRSRVNIADVVGDYLTLKTAGVGSLKGLCPFHDERSPSFHVRAQVGRYHCFGCGEDGDVFTFLQRVDHLTFTEAVERMAAKVGVELHYEDGAKAGGDSAGRARLLAANKAAEDYFASQLLTNDAEAGRTFLKQRGFDEQAALQFGIGFAPKGYSKLGEHLHSLGFSEQELLGAGLIGKGERGNYDRFRGRLTWPIRDTTGHTLGFGARKLFEDDQGPKYLNTPETEIYHKSQVLYGLDLAKKDISRSRKVVVVEGYTDVMACHLAGVPTAIATCGTAFGTEHIKLIRRVLGDVENVDTHGLGEVIFTFDPDEAGQKAATRAFAEEQRFAAQTFVAIAPDGLDPCDLRLKKGDAAVRRLIEERRPMFEFMIRRILAGFDLETVEGRSNALTATAPLISGIRDAAMHDGYIRSVAGWIGVDPTQVTRAVRVSGSKPRSISATSQTESVSEPETRVATVSITKLPNDPAVRLERDALMAAIQQPMLVGSDLIRRLVLTPFSNEHLALVRNAIGESLEQVESTDWLNSISASAGSEISPLVFELALAPMPQKLGRDLSNYCKAVVVSLIGRGLTAKKNELIGKLQRTERESDPEQFRNIQEQLMGIENERRALTLE